MLYVGALTVLHWPQLVRSMPNGYLVPFQPKAEIVSFLYALVQIADYDDDYLTEFIVETLRVLDARRPAAWSPCLKPTIAQFTNEGCRTLFRFLPRELLRMLPLLRLEGVQTQSRNICEAEEGLLLMLARLSFPGRWVDHMQLFGGGEGFLSEVFNDILDPVTEVQSEL